LNHVFHTSYTMTEWRKFAFRCVECIYCFVCFLCCTLIELRPPVLLTQGEKFVSPHLLFLNAQAKIYT